MATNGQRFSTSSISGEQSEFKRTIIKRGYSPITLSSATTNSTGSEGSATIDITDIYQASLNGLTFPPFGFPKVEVSLFTQATASNAIAITPLPFTNFTTSNAVDDSGYFEIVSGVNVVPVEAIYVNLNVYVRLNSRLLAGLLDYGIYYTIYSEVAYAGSNWDFKA